MNPLQNPQPSSTVSPHYQTSMPHPSRSPTNSSPYYRTPPPKTNGSSPSTVPNPTSDGSCKTNSRHVGPFNPPSSSPPSLTVPISTIGAQILRLRRLRPLESRQNLRHRRDPPNRQDAPAPEEHIAAVLPGTARQQCHAEPLEAAHEEYEFESGGGERYH
jgi:hypothetical protein